MIDKWMIVGGAHFAVAGVLLKLLGWILPCCITSYYTCIANFLLYVYVAKFTFEITKKYYLNERLSPENRAVFITGCDSGFGHHLAKHLDSIGYPVFAGCLDKNSAGANALKESCSKRLQVLENDVTQDASVRKAVDFVKENLGPSELWAIVNNAGISKGFEVELSDMQTFKDTLEVNTFGPIRVTKAFLPLLRQSRGRVVNVTSLAGRLALPYCTPYTMSKFAAVAFTECLKQEMDVWGIRVISIEPESFKTAIFNTEALKRQAEEAFSKLDPDIKEDYGEKYVKNFKKFLQLVSHLYHENIQPVVNSLDDAISSRYPNSVYTPCRNILTQIVFYVAKKVPLGLRHAVLKLAATVAGFPKPREAENYL